MREKYGDSQISNSPIKNKLKEESIKFSNFFKK